MTTKADLIARLQNGDTVDQIAEEMTKALNEAKAEYEAETKRKEEEKAKEALAEEGKHAAAADLLDAFCDYLYSAGEEELLTEVQKMTEDDIIETLDSVIEMAHTLDRLKQVEFKLPDKSFLKEFFNL